MTKAKPKTKAERRFGSFWQCPNCEGNPEFEHAAMMKHIQKVHGIDPKHVTGKRNMLMHLDGADYYSSQYEWEINGLKFYQSTCNKRTGEDAAYWG